MPLSGLSLIVLLVLYLPVCMLLILHLRKMLRSNDVSKRSIMFITTFLSLGLFLLPTWDAIAGKYYLNLYCKTDGGTYINTNEVINGIYYRSTSTDENAIKALKRGFDFVEFDNEKEGYVRFNLQGDKLEKSYANKLKSKYEWGYALEEQVPNILNVNLFVTERFVRQIEDGRKIAGFKNYLVSPWVDNLWGDFSLQAGRECKALEKYKTDQKYQNSILYLQIISGLVNHKG